MDGGSWHCTRGSDQNHPQEKEMQEGEMAVRGCFTNTWVKKRGKKNEEKRKDRPIWMRSSREEQGEIRKQSEQWKKKKKGKQQNGRD